MKVYKSGMSGKTSLNPAQELEAINTFAKTQLKAEQVYIFSVILCDNEIDRDNERFSEETLGQLKELFIGVTGIFDHEWKAANQTARIYRTEIVESERVKNAIGLPYMALKGYAYMLRSEKNQELIQEIEAGIKKETSVGCSISHRGCSICGSDDRQGGCGHIPGREYDGKLCYVELLDAVDAYEWSFVAVPAQKGAGVAKRFGAADTLKSFIETEDGSCFAGEFERLSKEAALGREYRDELKKEVLRLSLICDRKLHEAMNASIKNMQVQELSAVKAYLENQLSQRFPPRTQLPGKNLTTTFDGDEYMV